MERLRFLREKRGLSQQDLADLIGSTQPTIHKYETGANQPDIQTLGLLADVFETSVDYLVEHTDVPHKIEPVEPFQLNAEEAALMEEYRALPPRKREGVAFLLRLLQDDRK